MTHAERADGGREDFAEARHGGARGTQPRARRAGTTSRDAPNAAAKDHTPLEVLLSDGARGERVRVALDGVRSTAAIPAGVTPTAVTVDPDGWLYALPRCDTPGAQCREGTRCASTPQGRVCTQ